MYALSLVPTSLLSLLLAWFMPLAHANYFVVQQPSQGTQWTNGQANPVQWTKGVGDGVVMTDIEMSRISVDGLIFVAQNVPTSPGSINIFIQDLPEADDYYLLFLNSTVGVMYGTSPRFSVSGSSNASSPIANAPTVSVSGAPNPTDVFATTFPALANGVAVPGWKAVEGAMPQLLALFGTMAVCLLSGAWIVL
ncbi:hypothetical protein NM688_g2176 [Phlebia brevispora]|uniref:Uncharacterized protein n=1 Tax=Phlebia brevispora TaxID=194682 RepID=A0ACC1T9F1_9APHY|nr:hypothetical protein NM688_g2176 [Phlebia brevispora]